jgi:hypothetical protein
MSQTEQEIAAIEEQLLLDRIAFGTSWKVTYSDGTIERVPPDQVRMRQPRRHFVRHTWHQDIPRSN